MLDYEKKREKEQQRSSQGRLREGAPKQEQDGKEHLTGYRPHEQEGSGTPREHGRLENSFGDIAVGTNKKKEVAMVVSRRRNQQGPAVREDEKVLKGDSAARMDLVRGRFMANSFDKNQSAVGYRQSHKKAPYNMIKQMKDMMKDRDQQVMWEQAAFLNREPEQEELKRLERLEQELRRQGASETGQHLQDVARRRQEVRRVLDEKEGQERRLRMVLEKAREEAGKRDENEGELLRRFFVQAEEELSDEDGELPEDTGAEELPGGENEQQEASDKENDTPEPPDAL